MGAPPPSAGPTPLWGKRGGVSKISIGIERVDPHDASHMLALCLASTAFYGPPAAFQQQRMASPLAREKPVQLATSIKGTPIWE